VINVICRDMYVTKIFEHFIDFFISFESIFFSKSTIYFCVYEKLTKSMQSTNGRPTGRTFVLLQWTHVHALGLIAVASKFVGICHRTANWFFRETRQLLTRCQRCKILLQSHVCLICTSKYFVRISCARCFCAIMMCYMMHLLFHYRIVILESRYAKQTLN